MSQIPEVGDLVVCNDPEWRGTMRLPSEPGIVLDLRKDQGKVFYPSLFGEAWIPHHHLGRIRDPLHEKALPEWMQRVWFLAKTLPTIFLQVERFGPSGNAVRIYHHEIEASMVDVVRESLAGEIRYYALAPAGLHKLESNIAFEIVDSRPRPIPRPAPEPAE